MNLAAMENWAEFQKLLYLENLSFNGKKQTPEVSYPITIWIMIISFCWTEDLSTKTREKLGIKFRG